MKLHEVADDSLVASMFAKLRAAGEEVYFDALGASFKTGNDRSGWETRRHHTTGWAQSHSVDRSGKGWLLVLTSLAKHERGKGTYSSYHVNLEQPLDNHYTIKKVDGVWTILDKVKTESRIDREHETFMLKMAMKKMIAAGLKCNLVETARGVHIRTETPVFSIHTFYDPIDKNGNEEQKKWFNAWFKDGLRSSSIIRCATVEDIIKDIGFYESE